VVIASVNNTGTITATDVSATLINIENHANVTVKCTQGATCKFSVWNVVNKGRVSVEGGHFMAKMICPSNGHVVIAAGVTGTIQYEAGCKGTVTNNAGNGVTEEKLNAFVGSVVSGELDVTVTDVDAFLQDDNAKNSATEGIAETAGVPKTWVTVSFSKITRRLQAVERRLASNLKMSYTITVPPTETSATAAVVDNKVQAATPSEIQAKVAEKMTANSVTGQTLTVQTKSTPVVAAATTTTTAQDSTSTTAAQGPDSTTTTATQGSPGTSGARTSISLLGFAVGIYGMLA
jgi:hypothetical protein